MLQKAKKKDIIKNKIMSKTQQDLEQGGMTSKSLKMSFKNTHLCYGKVSTSRQGNYKLMYQTTLELKKMIWIWDCARRNRVKIMSSKSS